MIYCPHCGKPINEEQVICLSCGRQVQPLKVELPLEKEEKNVMRTCIIIVAIFIIIMFVVTTLPMFFAS